MSFHQYLVSQLVESFLTQFGLQQPMLGTMSHPQLISSQQLSEQGMNVLLDNGNSLTDDFLAHEGMISTVLGDCMKEDTSGPSIGDKHDKTPLMGWGSMLEQVSYCYYLFSLLFTFSFITFRTTTRTISRTKLSWEVLRSRMNPSSTSPPPCLNPLPTISRP